MLRGIKFALGRTIRLVSARIGASGGSEEEIETGADTGTAGVVAGGVAGVEIICSVFGNSVATELLCSSFIDSEATDVAKKLKITLK